MYSSESTERWLSWKPSTTPCQWIGTLSIVMSQFSPQNSNLLSIIVEKEWWLIGQEVVLLMNTDYGPCSAWHKKYSTLQNSQLHRFYCYQNSTLTKPWSLPFKPLPIHLSLILISCYLTYTVPRQWTALLNKHQNEAHQCAKNVLTMFVEHLSVKIYDIRAGRAKSVTKLWAGWSWVCTQEEGRDFHQLQNV